jgi:hypothetical protein
MANGCRVGRMEDASGWWLMVPLKRRALTVWISKRPAWRPYCIRQEGGSFLRYAIGWLFVDVSLWF